MPSPRSVLIDVEVGDPKMQFDKFTLKSQEAVAAAQSLAASRNQQSIEPEHLLHGLLADPEGVVFPLVQRLGSSPRALRDKADELIDRIPKTYTSGGAAPDRVGASPALMRVLER